MSEDTLMVELRGELFKLEKFELTFGDALRAKRKASLSTTSEEYEKRHEMLWLTQIILEKNGIEKDIDWIVDVPMAEMQHILKQVKESNPSLGK